MARTLWRARGEARLPVGGHSFRFVGLRPPHYVSALLTRKGRYEPEVVRFLQQTLRPGDTFLDVGAHMGMYSMLASRIVGPDGGVWAFEPDPEALRMLRSNLAANQLSNVTVVAAAAAEREGTARLALAEGNCNGNLAEEGLEIKTVSLDAYCEQRGIKPDVVKMDIEGGERVAVPGATQVLSHVRGAVVELHGMFIPDDAPRVLALLRSLGEVERLDSRYGDSLTDGNVDLALTSTAAAPTTGPTSG